MRPEPGFSLYEGRTRGKRLKYTYSDDEADLSDATSTRRSTRVATPADASKPVVTASGRQVRSRIGGQYGESMLSGQTTNQPTPATGDYDGSEISDAPATRHDRATRSGVPHQVNGYSNGRKHIAGYNELDEMDDEEDAMSSGGEWDGGDDDEVDDRLDDNDEDGGLSTDDEDDFETKSLVVKLRYRTAPGNNARRDNAYNAASPSILPNGTATCSAANGYHAKLDDEQDSDTIVVKPQSLPNTARPIKQETGPTISQLTSHPLHPTSFPTTSALSSRQSSTLPPSNTLATNQSASVVASDSSHKTHSTQAPAIPQDTKDLARNQSSVSSEAAAPVAASTSALAATKPSQLTGFPPSGALSSVPQPHPHSSLPSTSAADFRQ